MTKHYCAVKGCNALLVETDQPLGQIDFSKILSHAFYTHQDAFLKTFVRSE